MVMDGAKWGREAGSGLQGMLEEGWPGVTGVQEKLEVKLWEVE